MLYFPWYGILKSFQQLGNLIPGSQWENSGRLDLDKVRASHGARGFSQPLASR